MRDDGPCNLQDLLLKFDNVGLPCTPVHMNLDGPFDEISLRGDYIENIDRILSIPICFFNLKSLGGIPERQIFSNGADKEIFSYVSKNSDAVFRMSPREFEYLIASIFREFGFEAELTPESNDNGVDIIALRNDRVIGTDTILIECKRYAPENKVGIGVVQRLFGAVSEFQANKGIVVTTSTFTKKAQKTAQRSLNKIELRDMNNIRDWIKELI